MKNSINILIILIIFITLLVLQGNVNAVTWQDDFEFELENSWQLQGNDSTWQIEQGFLRARVETQKHWQTLFELYQFIAFPGPYNNLTINIENIGTSGENRIGFALGRHFLNDAGEVEETGYYLFFTNDMQASRNGKVFLGPGRRWHTDVLNEMLLQFEDGRFQLFGDGESRLDFIDANLTTLDIIGFVFVAYVTDREITNDAWVEKIAISGLAVSPKNKLTTIWGHLKRK